jgi:hypothetical protein
MMTFAGRRDKMLFVKSADLGALRPQRNEFYNAYQ